MRVEGEFGKGLGNNGDWEPGRYFFIRDMARVTLSRAVQVPD